MTACAAQSGAVYMASPWIFCESLRLATAPYYREARVTIAWWQTACRMRHCCARRIEECRGRRILVSTPTRSAERQRMIEAEASRIAMLNAALPRAGIPIPEAKGLFKPETANLNAFLLDGHTARFLSRERKWGVCSCRPQAAFFSAPVRNLTARVRAIS